MNSAVIPVLLLDGISFLSDFISQRTGKDLLWGDMAMISQAAVIAVGIIILAIAILINLEIPKSVFIYQCF
jgi:membrane-associated protease RseP (regulator of RpoE activity)